MRTKRAVVAIGGNSLIKDKQHQTVPDQYQAMKETTASIADMVQAGWEVAISHGNGPQVGFILRRSELSRHELHEVPLDVCGADSQGAIGYALQQNLRNHLAARGVERPVVTVVTEVEVSPDDPAWRHPSKPIGSFMTQEVASARKSAEGWTVVEDAGRGWRRVVPSPEPLRIVEADVVRLLLDSGVIVITVGGGGIPVVRRADGSLKGVDAVIDKDLASAMLATVIEAGLLVITTAVEKVALGWGTPQQRWVDRLTLAEAKAYLAEGTHFAPGSMAPKIQACVQYLEAGGGEVLITDPDHLPAAIRGETGTRIVP
jgi:carbamate kinase